MRHLLLILLLVTAKAAAGPPDTSFVPGALYDAHIPPPDSVLGCALGSRPARYGEIVAYLNVLAQRSDRVQLTTKGTTHEGRAEYLLVISSKENRHRLEEIRRDMG